MALNHCNFHSDALGMACSMDVILPEQTERQIGMTSRATDEAAPPVLYLLHGLSDDHTIWQRRTSIERYVAPLGLAVVMPCVHRSFYTNMAFGYRYWDFISEEVPAKVARLFRVSSAREDTYVAGLSMGGYGAFKLALRRPDRFAAAASLSGALYFGRRVPEFHADYDLIFGEGDGAEGTQDDVYRLAEICATSDGPVPRLYQCCGTEDFLHADNVAFRDHARGLGLSVTYEEGAGAHEWGYWDVQIQRVLTWFGETAKGVQA